MKNLIHEIHRRSLWQVLGVYLAASWIVLQVVDVIGNNFGLPEWVPPSALILLLIGLPIVLATAVVQEGVSTRPAKTQEASPDDDALAGLPPVPEPEVRGHHRLFTWRNALLGGAAAFTLLGVGTAGWMAMRTLGIGPAGTLVAKGVLEERERLVLADFESASDTVLARTVTETLRRALTQSAILTFHDRSQLAETLQRMGRDPSTTPIDRSTAREIALRNGLKGVVGGAVDRIGSGYAVSADLILAESGETAFSHQETARDDSELVDAIDRLSRKFRERVGESLREVHSNPPLAQVTTESLEALEKAVQGAQAYNQRGDVETAIRLLEEAVTRDTAFAMAYRQLGVIYINTGRSRERLVEVMTKAVRHENRLTERERYHVRGIYHTAVTFDDDEAIAAFQRLVELGDSARALNNLSALYARQRRFEEAERAREILVERRLARSAQNYDGLAMVKFALGKTAEARAVLDAGRERFPEHPVWDALAIHLAVAERRYEQAAEALGAFEAAHGGDPNWRALPSWQGANLAWLRGRLREAERHYRENMRIQEEMGFPQFYLGAATELAGVLRDRGDHDAAIRVLREALDRHPLDSIPPLDRPYTGLAIAYARVGESERARGLLAEYEAEVDTEVDDPRGVAALYPSALIALNDGSPLEAASLIRQLDKRWARSCPICALDDLGVAYDAAGVADSTIAVYERYLNTPWLFRTYDDARARARILERLGQLHDQRADLESAAEYYAQFVELWAEADEELQPRVRAAQARLEEIVRERG